MINAGSGGELEFIMNAGCGGPSGPPIPPVVS